MNSPVNINKTRVFKGQNLRAVCYYPNRSHLLVCFDHWRIDRRGFPKALGGVASIERHGCAILNVHTNANDWYLNSELPLLRRALRKFTAQYDRVTAQGFSMGGFAALLLAPDLRLSFATLISPQYSIQAARVPFEKRYREEAKSIAVEHDSFDLDYAKTLEGALLYDPLWRADRLHKELICNDFPKIKPTPLWAGGHPAIKVIVAKNKWPNLMTEIAKPQPDAGAYMRLHKSLRIGHPPYLKAMNNHLSMRKHSKLRVS